MASKKHNKEQQKKGNGRNILIVFLLLGLLILAVWGGSVLIWQKLFVRNSRFTLRRAEVRSTAHGFWAQNKDRLLARAGITPGKDNIFALRLRDIRKDVRNIPSVENAEISRMLPDTLVLNIVERIPRAVIDNHRSPWVVDEKGVVMPRHETMFIPGALPVITESSRQKNPEPGRVMDSAVPALKLIMETLRSFPDISVIQVNTAHPDKLTFSLQYRNQKMYRAMIPKRTGQLNYLLNVLQSTIINLIRNGDDRSTIDLTFSGSAVIR